MNKVDVVDLVVDLVDVDLEVDLVDVEEEEEEEEEDEFQRPSEEGRSITDGTP